MVPDRPSKDDVIIVDFFIHPNHLSKRCALLNIIRVKTQYVSSIGIPFQSNGHGPVAFFAEVVGFFTLMLVPVELALLNVAVEGNL